MRASSKTTSPRLMPMRKRMRRVSSTSALRCAMTRWIATAHSTALRTLGNSARIPSPAVYPHCRARDGFVTAVLLPAWSQRADRPRRVGVLFSGLTLDPAMRPPVLQALVDGLREHGWEEGRNVALEVRYADLDPARLLELAAELT